DSLYEKFSALSATEGQKHLREEGVFLETYSVRHGPEPVTEASVEYLQEMARIRLCLDRASDLLSGLQEGSEVAEDKQRYLRQVERFCRQVRNDWYRVYLVRKLTSLRGMEFVQRLSRPGHPARWLFPQAVLEQQ
ncbi:E3 ubiquitin-protein ligase RNF213-like, partial [Hyaena hyaena]